MKKLFGIIFAIVMAFNLAGCDNVRNGYVGVKVDRYGDNRGVQNEVLGPGRYYVGWNTDIYDFPTFTITDTYSRSSGKDSKDESLNFQTSEGMVVNADFGISFHIEPANVPKVFIKYRRGVEEISDIYLRNMLRDALVDAAGEKSVDDLMLNKLDFTNTVQADVIKRAASVGITVESISSLGSFRWPENITASINGKMKATQEAMRVENELRETKAQAEKDVAQSEAKVRIAQNDAKAIALQGEALAKNPAVLQQMWIDKWDGKLPTITSGATPLVQIPNLK